MNPLAVFDAREVVPNSFALALAAAARVRALRQGSEPRIDADVRMGPDLALSEIAAGTFAQEELAPFLPDAGRVLRLASPESRHEIGDGSQPAVAAPVPAQGTVH